MFKRKKEYLEWDDYSKLINNKEQIRHRSKSVLDSANNHQEKIRRNGGFLIKDESVGLPETEMLSEATEIVQKEAIEEEE